MSAKALPAGSIQPLIVDDHDASRLGHALLLRRQPWVSECFLARDPREGSELASRHRPEVALLDVSNSGPFIASTTAALRTAHPGMTIVLTSRCSPQLADAPESLGAAAFIPPGAPSSEILASVRSAVLPAPTPTAAPTSDRAEDLTDRDRRLLGLISTGATNREIARTGPEPGRRQEERERSVPKAQRAQPD